MTITVSGVNWDVAVLEALAAHPPPSVGSVERHLHVSRLLVETIGSDMKSFLSHHGGKYIACWRRPEDPVAALVGWLADYYLHLYDFTIAGSRAISNWDDAMRSASTLESKTRMLVGMQLGYVLLLPILVENATGRAAYPIVHDGNPAVIRMYQERLHLGRPLVLTALGPSDIRRWLDSDGIMLLNIDTSYPGTRQVRSVPFLEGHLTVPSGLLSLATRRSFGIQAMAAPGYGGQIGVTVSPPLPHDLDGALRRFAAHFENWVAEYPEQWMGWASLAQTG